MPSSDDSPLLAIGAHPDDIEFGCGGVLAKESQTGRQVHLVICSRGEAGSNGTPQERAEEAAAAARALGATLEFIDLGGDAHIARSVTNTLVLARLIRQHRPRVVLAPTLVENQHPDHPIVGALTRDAARLARYGGVAELQDLPSHSIGQLLFYAITAGAEPEGQLPLLVDVSDERTVAAWTRAMSAHGSQLQTREYVELQLARARLHGLRAGVSHALPLWANDPPVFDSLAPLDRGARHF